MIKTFSVVTHVRSSSTQVFWFLSDPSTASIIDPADGGLIDYRVIPEQSDS